MRVIVRTIVLLMRPKRRIKYNHQIKIKFKEIDFKKRKKKERKSKLKFDFNQLIWGFAPNPRIFKKQNQ